MMSVSYRLLASAREGAQITQSQLAALTGIPAEEIASIEDGTVAPSAEDLWLLAMWLNVPVARLIEDLAYPS